MIVPYACYVDQPSKEPHKHDKCHKWNINEALLAPLIYRRWLPFGHWLSCREPRPFPDSVQYIGLAGISYCYRNYNDTG